MQTYQEIESELRRIIFNASPEIKPEEINSSSRFVEDLGFDSLDSVEISMELEDLLGIEMPEEIRRSLATFEDAVNYLRNPEEYAVSKRIEYSTKRL